MFGKQGAAGRVQRASRLVELRYCAPNARRNRNVEHMYEYCTYIVPYTAWPGVIDGFGRYWARALEMHHFTILNRYNALVLNSRIHHTDTTEERIIFQRLNKFRLLSATTRSSAPAPPSTTTLAAKPANFVIALLGCAPSPLTIVNTSHLQDNADSKPRVMLSIHSWRLLTIGVSGVSFQPF